MRVRPADASAILEILWCVILRFYHSSHPGAPKHEPKGRPWPQRGAVPGSFPDGVRRIFGGTRPAGFAFGRLQGPSAGHDGMIPGVWIRGTFGGWNAVPGTVAWQ
ncbi:hypothetical protein GCM10009628_27570 [Paeniglutamicibacter kerguelensis]